MSEAHDCEIIFLGNTFDICQIFCDLVDRNNNVALVEEFCLRLDRLEEGASRCPCIFLLCRCVRNENIDCSRIKNNFSNLLGELFQLVHAVTIECHKKVSTDVNTFDLLREYALSEITLGSEDDLFLHELHCLRLEMIHEELRNGRDTVFQVLIRDDQADRLLRSRDEF